MHKWVATTVLLLSVVWAIGCGSGSGRPNKDKMSPAEYFNQTQGNTMTPSGKIKPGSAQNAGEGTIRYQTEDGKRWEVTATPDGQGYKYSGPRAVD